MGDVPVIVRATIGHRRVVSVLHELRRFLLDTMVLRQLTLASFGEWVSAFRLKLRKHARWVVVEPRPLEDDIALWRCRKAPRGHGYAIGRAIVQACTAKLLRNLQRCEVAHGVCITRIDARAAHAVHCLLLAGCTLWMVVRVDYGASALLGDAVDGVGKLRHHARIVIVSAVDLIDRVNDDHGEKTLLAMR